MQSEQIAVPPGGTHVYRIELTLHKPGPFDAVAELLVESPRGVQAVPVRVVGKGKPKEKRP